MPTLTGFTRPSDPIESVSMGSTISTAIGKTVTVVVTPTDVQVTGATVSESDRTAIQAAMTAYIFPFLQYGAPISDNPDMSGDRHDRGVTEHAAYVSDLVAYNAANRAQGSGSTVTTGAWPILRKATTNSSGVATIYLTTDGTSGTSAAFSSTVLEDGIQATPVGAANYNATSLTVSGDKKTLTVVLNQIKTVLGLLTFNSTADSGVEVRTVTWGK